MCSDMSFTAVRPPVVQDSSPAPLASRSSSHVTCVPVWPPNRSIWPPPRRMIACRCFGSAWVWSWESGSPNLQRGTGEGDDERHAAGFRPVSLRELTEGDWKWWRTDFRCLTERNWLSTRRWWVHSIATDQRVQERRPQMRLPSVQHDERRRGRTQSCWPSSSRTLGRLDGRGLRTVVRREPFFHQLVGQGQVQGETVPLAQESGASLAVLVRRDAVLSGSKDVCFITPRTSHSGGFWRCNSSVPRSGREFLTLRVGTLTLRVGTLSRSAQFIVLLYHVK